jgi:hypothetical protein
MSLTIAQQDDLRQVCLEFLAIRYPNAYTADAIGRMLMRRQRIDYDVSPADMAAALAWLAEEFLATRHIDRLSVIPAWQATSAGVAHYQRGRIAANPEEASGL